MATLPTADSLLASLAALERKLDGEDVTFRARTFTGTSTDTKVTAVADGLVNLVSVTIAASAWPPPADPTALAASIKDACGKALTAANDDTKPRASAAAATYALTGIPNANQAAPDVPGFASAVDDLTARLRAQDPIISALQFQGDAGPASAVVDGTLTLKTLGLFAPLPAAAVDLQNRVVQAVNIALDKAKRLFEDGLHQRVQTGVDSSAITPQQACLYANDTLLLADRVQVKEQNPALFAPVVNAGSTDTNLGDNCQVGDLWSRSKVELRNHATVNGALRTMSTLDKPPEATVSGPITTNGALLRIPTVTFSVTFPGTVQPSQEAKSGQPPLDLKVGAYDAISVKGTLLLSPGTYFFNSFTSESASKVLCKSGTNGQINVHVKGDFTMRGTMGENGSTGRPPKLFVSVFGANVTLEQPFPGMFVALNALINLPSTAKTPHTGCFYGKTISVQPDVKFTRFPPFSGAPALGSR